MDGQETLQFAGDIEVEEISITTSTDTYDLSNFMIEFNLYEDVFSPCMYGSVVIFDTANIITEFPIIGTELITVKLRTPTLEDAPENIIEKTFQLYSIVDRSLKNDRSQTYSLEFISKEGYADNVVTLNKTMSGSTDELALEVFKTVQTPRKIGESKITGIIVEDTPHVSNIKYTSNNWSPFKNLNFIGKRVKGAVLNGSDYLIYESNKSFYFSSVEATIASQLATGAVFDEYVYELQPGTISRSDVKKFGNTFPDEVTRVESISLPKVLDLLDGQDSGYFGSVIRGYDMFTKKMSEDIFDNRINMKDFAKTGEGNPIPGDVFHNPFTVQRFESYNSALYNDYGLTREDQALKTLGRTAYLNSFNQFKFQITIPGRTDIEVGNLISLLYPSAKSKLGEETEIDDVLDPLLSGVYFISAIHHVVNPERHYMVCEIIKNGLNKSLGERETEYKVDQ